MIEITRLNNSQIIINSGQIECIEETPDTTITMMNGKKYIARETVDEIIKKIIESKKKFIGI